MKKFILVENINQYQFCDDLWGLIKDYAGIYNIDVNWNGNISLTQYVNAMSIS